MEKYSIWAFNVCTARYVGYDVVHWSITLGDKLSKSGRFDCFVRIFDQIIQKSYAGKDDSYLCKIYVLLPSDKHITTPSMPKSCMSGETFVRSCFEAFRPYMRRGCCWLVKCIWQPGTYWLRDVRLRNNIGKPGYNFSEEGNEPISDDQLDHMDMLMRPNSIRTYLIM